MQTYCKSICIMFLFYEIVPVTPLQNVGLLSITRLAIFTNYHY